mgnify:CR=1 FL=1
MACFSEAQSPKSINLQRSQQKGLNVELLFQTTGFEQEGHFTLGLIGL